jgi:hypothetical protein
MVKLVIKLPSSCPVGTQPDRHVVGEFDFRARGPGALSSQEIPQTSVTMRDGGTLLVQASYTPVNRGLSILTGHRAGEAEMHVFSTVTELEFGPAYFCFRLSTGQYVEFYLQNEAAAAEAP